MATKRLKAKEKIVYGAITILHNCTIRTICTNLHEFCGAIWTYQKWLREKGNTKIIYAIYFNYRSSMLLSPSLSNSNSNNISKNPSQRGPKVDLSNNSRKMIQSNMTWVSIYHSICIFMENKLRVRVCSTSTLFIKT